LRDQLDGQEEAEDAFKHRPVSRAGLAASMEVVMVASVFLVWRDGREYRQFRSRVWAIAEP